MLVREATLAELSPRIEALARHVRLVLLDADGVLTDGRIILGERGEDIRCFDVRDGLGIRLGQQAGLTFGIISGRASRALAARATELGISEIHQHVSDKLRPCREIQQRLGLGDAATCFMGDDLIDLPLMRRVGLAAAPADACAAARDAAHFVAAERGGRGAVRALVEMLLRASGAWDEVTRAYFE